MTTHTKLPITHFLSWLAHGERGMSSEAMVEHMTGVPVGGRAYAPRFVGGSYPADMGDFRRCELLLRDVTIARLLLPTMSSVSPPWARLVDRWDEIVASAEAEDPTIFTRRPAYAARRTSALIQKLTFPYLTPDGGTKTI